MTPPDSRHMSLWVDTMTQPRLPTVEVSDKGVAETADVVVIGAGVVGATTALLLARSGMTVLVIDAGEFGHNTTTHSTVKVTVGHGTALTRIARVLGRSAARVYADANRVGFETLAGFVHDLEIDCDLEERPHYIWAEDDRQAQQVRSEAQLAAEVGLPARFTRDVPLPVPATAAAVFDHQYQFHPGKYLAGLAEAAGREGVRFLTGVRATTVEDGRPAVVRTTRGDLRARRVVLATQYPFLDRGGHFAKLSPFRSYAVAGALPEGSDPPMAINVGSPIRSIRTVSVGERRLLIVVGEGHRVGEGKATSERYDRLEQWGARWFDAGPYTYRWSTQDASSLDHVPYVGRVTPGGDHIFMASGFEGWGMTNGTAAALLLTDLLTRRRNPWARTFDSRRIGLPRTGPKFIAQNTGVGLMWAKDRLTRPGDSVEDVAPGQARVLKIDGRHVAAYRDPGGHLHAVSATCTHLGCLVRWNDAERSWDCPCHGSRFSYSGEVLHGPAVSPLDRWRDDAS